MRTPEGLRSLQETSQNHTTELATGSLQPPSSRGPGTPARTSTLLALFPITIGYYILVWSLIYAFFVRGKRSPHSKRRPAPLRPAGL